jgi:hypothetical protein
MTPVNITAHVEKVLFLLREYLALPVSEEGLINPLTVEAVDVINHALAFVNYPAGLDHWRRALWQRELTDESRVAVETMMSNLIEALERSDVQAVTAICDCLHAFLPPVASFSVSQEKASAMNAARSGQL